MRYWILLPAYNEGVSLPRLLPKIAQEFGSRGADYRVVVVNDGSTDDTAAVLQRYAGEIPLDIVNHALNRGLGETERDGFEYVAAHGGEDDIVIRMDCDDTHEPAYCFTLLAKLAEGYDVVNTSRFLPGGGEMGLEKRRQWLSRAACLFMKCMFNIPGVRDYSCGYRAYRVRVIRDAIRIFGNNFIQLRGLGFTSTLEMLVKLHMLGCRFAEVPFVLRYDQKASASKMIGSVTTLGYLLLALLYHWPWDGWRAYHRGLAAAYRANPEAAVERYCEQRRAVKGINRFTI